MLAAEFQRAKCMNHLQNAFGNFLLSSGLVLNNHWSSVQSLFQDNIVSNSTSIHNTDLLIFSWSVDLVKIFSGMRTKRTVVGSEAPKHCPYRAVVGSCSQQLPNTTPTGEVVGSEAVGQQRAYNMLKKFGMDREFTKARKMVADAVSEPEVRIQEKGEAYNILVRGSGAKYSYTIHQQAINKLHIPAVFSRNKKYLACLVLRYWEVAKIGKMQGIAPEDHTCNELFACCFGACNDKYCSLFPDLDVYSQGPCFLFQPQAGSVNYANVCFSPWLACRRINKLLEEVTDLVFLVVLPSEHVSGTLPTREYIGDLRAVKTQSGVVVVALLANKQCTETHQMRFRDLLVRIRS